MKIVGFIGYIWMPKWHRYSACSYQDAFICPATGRALPPSRDCFLDEDLIFSYVYFSGQVLVSLS